MRIFIQLKVKLKVYLQVSLYMATVMLLQMQPQGMLLSTRHFLTQPTKTMQTCTLIHFQQFYLSATKAVHSK